MPEDVAPQFDKLLAQLREQGLSQIAENPRYDFLLRLAQQFEQGGSQRWASRLTPWLTASLMQQVHSALIRLENSSPQEGIAAAITLPSQALTSRPAEEIASPLSRLVYVIRPEPEVSVEVLHETLPSPKRWPVFMAGVCSALLIGAVVLWGWHYAHRVDGAALALDASVAALPKALTSEQIQTLRQGNGQALATDNWLKQASSQLDELATIPPDWAYQQGSALLNQA